MEHYTFAGCDAVALARTYGTPLYVVSEDEIERRIRRIRACFDERWERCTTFFAAKSFLTRDMLRLLVREGLGLDVVSGGELFLAREMGFPPERIAFHGNSKTEAEIAAGLDYGVGKFVCDSVDEIAYIDAMARRRHTATDILIRVTPGVDSHTHSYMATAGTDCKFGVPIPDLERAVSLCLSMTGVRLRGLHFHVGSQLQENTSHLLATDILLGLIHSLRERTGFTTEILDLGGGFGVPYTEKDAPQPVEAFVVPMVERVRTFCAENDIPRPALVIEPGRWIVAEAGITLYTVGSVKETPEGRTFVGVDGGFPDNPRPALYQAEYRAVLADRPDAPAKRRTTIAGKCCESGDIVIRDIAFPEARRGDTVAVLATGAYHHSMANNYNKHPIPAVVAVRDGVPRLSVRRQTCEEMYAAHL